MEETTNGISFNLRTCLVCGLAFEIPFHIMACVVTKSIEILQIPYLMEVARNSILFFLF